MRGHTLVPGLLSGLIGIVAAATMPWSVTASGHSAVPMTVPLPPPTALGCPVTVPTDQAPPGAPPAPDYYGNGTLWTVLWPQGRVIFEPGGPGFVLPDGALGMKWPWIPAIIGTPTVTGHRLDGAAPPAWAEVTGLATTQDGQQFYPSYLIFPTPGCWEVTARVGATRLTFVTLVVQVDGGPDWRPSSLP